MSAEEITQVKTLLDKVAEIREELEALPDSSANGQLIDASGHMKSCINHLKGYLAVKGVK